MHGLAAWWRGLGGEGRGIVTVAAIIIGSLVLSLAIIVVGGLSLTVL